MFTINYFVLVICFRTLGVQQQVAMNHNNILKLILTIRLSLKLNQ